MPPPAGRPRRRAPRADLRLRVRPVPRRDRLHPRRRRRLPQGRRDPRDAGRHRGRHRRHRLLHARPSRRSPSSRAGEVGYLITGVKDVTKLRVGDTLTTRGGGATEPLPGYRDVKPMVFCGLFPIDSDRFPELRDALEKLSLNDAALTWEPETSDALGFGFRCGFLGLLHMDIVRERLEREYDLELMATMPSVEYEVDLTNGETVPVHNPTDMPDPATHRRGARALHPRVDPRAEGVRRPDHGALPGAPRRPRRHALPLGRARAAHLRPAARRDRARLLRPAEVAHARLRVAGLRADRAAARRTSSSSTCCSPATRSTRSR